MHVPFTSDEALVEEARAGARVAFETLIQPLISPAYRLALVRVRDPSKADDCVQEAAPRAWRARAQLRGGAEGLGPWFLAIVANECRNWLRGRWIRVLRRDLPPLATESGPTEDRLVQSEDPRRALRAPRPEERAARLLRYWRGLGVEAGARRLLGAPGAAPCPNPRAALRVAKEVDAGRGAAAAARRAAGGGTRSGRGAGSGDPGQPGRAGGPLAPNGGGSRRRACRHACGGPAGGRTPAAGVGRREGG